MSSPEPAVLEARYTWGGDEFLFVEVSESMSLAANFRVMSIAAKLSAMQLPGIVDVCPANASLLVRFDPDVLPPSTLEETVRTIEGDLTHHHDHSLETRIIEVPVWYEDPFTAEVAERFREGFHQAFQLEEVGHGLVLMIRTGRQLHEIGVFIDVVEDRF